MQKINIGIVGLGSIGILLAVLLRKKKYKVFFDKNIKKEKIQVNIESIFYGSQTSLINYDKGLRNSDVIFICSKYPYLSKHLKSIKNTKAIIVPFLNGISHFDMLKKKFKLKYFISNIGKVVSRKKGAFNVNHRSNNAPEVIISIKNKDKSEINIIKKILKDIQFKIILQKDDYTVIWLKLIRISSISAVTALYNCNLGSIRKSKFKTIILNTLIKEALFLSRKIFKFNGKYNDIQKTIKSFSDNLTTSLQADINLKLNSELDNQLGAIVKLSNNYNIKIPMHKKIYSKLIKKCQKKF